MGKTLLQPTTHTENNLPTVKREDEDKSTEELIEEMKPYLNIASDQLLQPDEKVMNDLLKKVLR